MKKPRRRKRTPKERLEGEKRQKREQRLARKGRVKPGRQGASMPPTRRKARPRPKIKRVGRGRWWPKIDTAVIDSFLRGKNAVKGNCLYQIDNPKSTREVIHFDVHTMEALREPKYVATFKLDLENNTIERVKR